MVPVKSTPGVLLKENINHSKKQQSHIEILADTHM